MDTRSREQILKDVQLRNMNIDISDQVVAMANDMIRGTSKLTLMEAKLIRLLIMQVKPDDRGFDVFKIFPKDLARALQMDDSHIYKEADRMTDHLMREYVYIGDGNPKHRWKKFHWVDMCEYDGEKFAFKLSDQLKPYLINLKKWYTQYRLEDVISFKSGYSIRVYELIAMYCKNCKPYGDNVVEVYIDMDILRTATSTKDKYKSTNLFKVRVLDAAIEDINERSSYHVEYRDYKEGRHIVGFIFTIQSQARYNYRERGRGMEDAPKQIEGQMSLFDLPEKEED